MITFIPENILAAMKAIVASAPDVVFGGSIALVAVGLLERQVKDIDIFIKDSKTLSKYGLLKIERTEIRSETVTDTNGKEIQRTGLVINGVQCCVFSVGDEELEHSIEWVGERFGVDSFTIRCQNVNRAIKAKRSYADRSGKHKIDLKEIDQKLANIK